MRAYHNDYQIKTNILAQLQAHYDADEIIKGKYWENGKGCAVGCTIHSDNHREYETRFGIPEILAHLEDTIFENLPNERAKEWPLKFMSSIYVGADLSTVWPLLAIWILTDKEYGVLQYTQPESPQYLAIKHVADLYQHGYTHEQMAQAADAAITADAITADAVATADAYAAAAAYAGAVASVYASVYASRADYYVKLSDKLIQLLQNTV
jgi:hypothetical protein